MNKLIVLALMTFCALVAGAFERAIPTDAAGDITVVCGNPGGWRIDVYVEKHSGKEELVVKLHSDSASVPPRFSVNISVPQLDAHHLWRSGDMDRCQLRPDWLGRFTSSLGYDMPLYSFINVTNGNRLTVAASEVLRRVDSQFGVSEYGSRLIGCLSFFNGPEAPIRDYETRILLDSRPVFWSDAVRDGAEWISLQSGANPIQPSDAAFAPLYSTWYNFHQGVSADVIENECRLASAMGMKTIILDDGWQTDGIGYGYASCGDWEVSAGKFPDFAAHVRRVQDMGMKYMVWYSVPFVGKKSVNYARFKGKYLVDQGDRAVLDPRFPEVREFLCNLYADAMVRYGLDGFKLDFIDSFEVKEDPAVTEDYAGRDIKSIPYAVNVLMGDIYRRLHSLKPDVLVEFRQHYIGPAIRQYGNMLRANDCPGDMQGNRQRIVQLRLTSGGSAVHSDMLMWNPSDTPERAALNILSALFGVVQYSMRLESLPVEHLHAIRHWIDFSQRHCDTLLKGEFKPYHPEMCYPVIEAAGDDEAIVAVYGDMCVATIPDTRKTVILVNGTGADNIVIDLLREPKRVEARDVMGNKAQAPKVCKGLNRIECPESGYLILYY